MIDYSGERVEITLRHYSAQYRWISESPHIPYFWICDKGLAEFFEIPEIGRITLVLARAGTGKDEYRFKPKERKNGVGVMLLRAGRSWFRPLFCSTYDVFRDAYDAGHRWFSIEIPEGES